MRKRKRFIRFFFKSKSKLYFHHLAYFRRIFPPFPSLPFVASCWFSFFPLFLWPASFISVLPPPPLRKSDIEKVFSYYTTIRLESSRRTPSHNSSVYSIYIKVFLRAKRTDKLIFRCCLALFSSTNIFSLSYLLKLPRNSSHTIIHLINENLSL